MIERCVHSEALDRARRDKRMHVDVFTSDVTATCRLREVVGGDEDLVTIAFQLRVAVLGNGLHLQQHITEQR